MERTAAAASGGGGVFKSAAVRVLHVERRLLSTGAAACSVKHAATPPPAQLPCKGANSLLALVVHSVFSLLVLVPAGDVRRLALQRSLLTATGKHMLHTSCTFITVCELCRLQATSRGWRCSGASWWPPARRQRRRWRARSSQMSSARGQPPRLCALPRASLAYRSGRPSATRTPRCNSCAAAVCEMLAGRLRHCNPSHVAEHAQRWRTGSNLQRRPATLREGAAVFRHGDTFCPQADTMGEAGDADAELRPAKRRRTASRASAAAVANDSAVAAAAPLPLFLQRSAIPAEAAAAVPAATAARAAVVSTAAAANLDGMPSWDSPAAEPRRPAAEGLQLRMTAGGSFRRGSAAVLSGEPADACSFQQDEVVILSPLAGLGDPGYSCESASDCSRLITLFCRHSTAAGGMESHITQKWQW